MYNGEQIRVLLAKQKKSQRDLAEYVTGNPNSSIHNLFKNPTVKTIEAVADFFNVTIDSLFIRAQEPIDYATETDMENAYLKKLIKYQETEMNAFRLLNDSNVYMLEQLKHRVAELESRLKYIQAHPEVIGELEPLPRFELIVPAAKIHPDVKVYTNPTPEEKKQMRIKKKLEKQAEENIRKETLPD